MTIRKLQASSYQTHNNPTQTTKTTMTTKTLICDIGASTIKIGRAGKLVPDVVVPSLAGTPSIKYNSWKPSSAGSASTLSSSSSSEPRRLLGEDAIKAGRKQKMVYEYLFQDDSTNSSSSTSTLKIKDWTLLKELLEYAFAGSPTNMGIQPCHRHKYKVLIPRPYNMTNHSDMTALADLFLGELGFSAITMQEQAALVLYTKGIESGIVVEMGESVTQITPVYKGHAIPKLDRSFKIGGRVLTKYLTKLLRRRGYQVIEDDVEASQNIKEQFCYVPLQQFVDADRQLAANTTVLDETYKVANGTNVIVGGEQRFGAVEPIFKPSLCNVEQNGLADTIMDVIQESDIDLRADLYQHIILSGGTSLLSGLDERLQQDLNKLYNRDVLKNDPSRSMGWTPKVRASDQKYVVWEGASIVSEFISDERWIKRDEFLRDGIQSVLSKCLV